MGQYDEVYIATGKSIIRKWSKIVCLATGHTRQLKTNSTHDELLQVVFRV